MPSSALRDEAHVVRLENSHKRGHEYGVLGHTRAQSRGRTGTTATFMLAAALFREAQPDIKG